MDKAVEPKKRKYADEERQADSSGRSEQPAAVTVARKASILSGTSQEQAVEGERRQRIEDEKSELEDLHVGRRPIKRLRYDKSTTIDARGAAHDHPTVAAGSNPGTSGINVLPVETFALICAYARLNALKAGPHELTKLRTLNRRSNASIDLLPKMKKEEPTLHAAELTRRLIESAHIKRRREDDFFDYADEDGKGDPESWTRGYLHGHIEDIYAVMKFSDPDYNSVLLRAGLKKADQPNLQSQGGMLYRFAVNAGEFTSAERQAIADASVEVLESRKGGQVLAAKAFLHLKEYLHDDVTLQSHMDVLNSRISTHPDQELDDEFQDVFRRAEEERAVSARPGVSAQAQRKDVDLQHIRDAASYRSAHRRAWDNHRSEIAGKLKNASDTEVLFRAVIGLRDTDDEFKVEDVALAIRDKFYDAMSYREAEKSLTIATRELSDFNEKRAALLERSPRKDGRAD